MALAAISCALTMKICASAPAKAGLTKKFLSGVFKAAGNRMRVISLSGMDSYRNSDGATLSVQDWRKGKRNSASPIAQTFSQWPTCLISTKVGSRGAPGLCDLVECYLAANNFR